MTVWRLNRVAVGPLIREADYRPPGTIGDPRVLIPISRNTHIGAANRLTIRACYRNFNTTCSTGLGILQPFDALGMP